MKICEKGDLKGKKQRCRTITMRKERGGGKKERCKERNMGKEK